jgi:hypothetical protein
MLMISRSGYWQQQFALQRGRGGERLLNVVSGQLLGAAVLPAGPRRRNTMIVL